MKNIPKLAVGLAILTLSAAASAALSDAVYRFEIRIQGKSEVLTVRAKSGEMQAVKTNEKSVEYTTSTATLPAAEWKIMLNAGTAPRHDFVTCSKTSCTYGKRSKIEDYLKISIRPMEQNGELNVAFSYDIVKAVAPARGGRMALPEVNHSHASSASVMRPGEMLPISGSNGVVAYIKLLGTE